MKGFTLIELLVVILIIGILATIAFPWYQKALEKARAVEAREILDTVYKAEQMYYMIGGTYASSFGELDVDIPWPDAEKWGHWFGAAKGNERWVVNLERGTNSNVSLLVGRPSGPYEGAGFLYQMICTDYPAIPLHEMLCIEKKVTPHKFGKAAGAYCEKMMGGT
ncbi:MAG: prepilin-type N-terminal cleavage/methylation domain-containing protein, partial [Elusimicrobiaceae bacterium]|nr:prepilin-type N-terminal cleavage/methylation domain-containing protein [Elusimicrobiaceae bacterium]